jgi:hypothetical protein
VIDNIFVEIILYVNVHLWIGQYLYCECMLYIADVCLILLSIIKIEHAKKMSFYCFSFFIIFHPVTIIVNKLMKSVGLPGENHQILAILKF